MKTHNLVLSSYYFPSWVGLNKNILDIYSILLVQTMTFYIVNLVVNSEIRSDGLCQRERDKKPVMRPITVTKAGLYSLRDCSWSSFVQGSYTYFKEEWYVLASQSERQEGRNLFNIWDYSTDYRLGVEPLRAIGLRDYSWSTFV